MATDDLIKHDKAKTPKRWTAHLRTVVIVLVLEGLLFGVWAMTRPEPPQTALPKELQKRSGVLQRELEEEKKKTREAKQHAQSQIRLKEARYANLKRKLEDLNGELALAIPTIRLPIRVQAQTSQQTLKNIETVCREHARVNPTNVAALVAVLVEIQQHGTINTALDAKQSPRQFLYKQIQVLLQAIGSYSGDITGAQTNTLMAVKAFQTENQLKVDGKVGLKTYMGMAKRFARERLDSDGPKRQHASSRAEGVRSARLMPPKELATQTNRRLSRAIPVRISSSL